ncbi:MAG: SLATT domain-containing protein [Bryobacterales bacterium]|nr:SLATT domain-containing protein [Bryobacterales bacterium]
MESSQDVLLRDWFRRARESQRVHYLCATRYHRLHYLLGMPTILFSCVVGTAVFSSVDKISSTEMKITLGLISIAAAALSSLQTFLQLEARAEKHKTAGARYGAVRRALELLATFPPTAEGGLRLELETVKKELDDLSQTSPHVPSDLRSDVDAELKARGHNRIFNLPKEGGPSDKP